MSTHCPKHHHSSAHCATLPAYGINADLMILLFNDNLFVIYLYIYIFWKKKPQMNYIYPQPSVRVTHIPTPAPSVEPGQKCLLPPSLIHTLLSECPKHMNKSSWLLYLFENKNHEKKKNTVSLFYVGVVVFTLLSYNCSQ